jgi:serine/threonine-protein kinase
LWCDVSAFDRAIDQGEPERAAEFYHGPFLSGFFLKGNADFDQWVEGERHRLGRAYGKALESLAEEAVEQGDVEQAVEWLRRLAAHSPYSTRAALKYMQALAASGDRAGALTYAERLSERVQEDLGAAPSPDVTALASQLRKEPAGRKPTRSIRVKEKTPADSLDVLRHALESRYTIERELGAGGMATVYLAADLKHHRKVAVKVLRPELAAVLGAERFLKEIEVTANLQHPHILPLHDSGEADSFLYYVMPYLEGESLREKLNRDKQLGVDETVKIAEAVAAALDYAHRQGVIHRDIKPENILIHDGQPVVADFGIALAVTTAGATRLTETGLSPGTPQYMSPEQATGEREVTAQSDVYSLGAVVYEMLVGDPPHTGNTVQAVIAKVVSVEPEPVSHLRSTIPGNVEAAVQKALAKVPADRFVRATEFAEALTNPAFTLPSIATLGETLHLTLAWKRRALGVFGLAAVAIVMALWGWIRNVPPPPEPPAWLLLDIPSAFDLSPDGSRVVYVREGELYVRDIADPEPRALGVQGARSPFFSPDGSAIGFFGGGARISRVSSEGGPPTPLVHGLEGDAPFHLGAWGSDGNIYFTTDNTSGLFLVPADGGESQAVTTLDSASGEISHRHPEILPNEKGIVYTSWKGDSSHIMVYEFETQITRRIAEGSKALYHPEGYLVFGTRTGTLQAVPFDGDRMMPTGSPVVVVPDVNLSGSGNVHFDLANDGTLVFQPSSERRGSVVLVDSMGRETALLEDNPLVSGHARLSPDGLKLATARFTSVGSEIWVDSLGGQRWRVTGIRQNHFPSWSPDGEYLVFGSDRAGGLFSLYTKRSDGSGVARLLVKRDISVYTTRWLPDGSIVFVLRNRGVWMVPADGSEEPRRVLPFCDHDNGTNCVFFDFSPDGQHFLFYRDGEVYVAETDDPAGTRIPVSLERSGRARWSVDGGKIYYRVQEQMMSAVFEKGERLRIGRRTRLFDTGGFWEARRFQVDPLGRGFVMVREVDAQQPLPVIVLNFISGLKTQLRN